MKTENKRKNEYITYDPKRLHRHKYSSYNVEILDKYLIVNYFIEKLIDSWISQ